RGCRLQDKGVAASDRLVEAHEDLAVGELTRGLRGDVGVQLLGDLFGQLRMCAAREEHQVLAVIGPVVAHVPPLLLRDYCHTNTRWSLSASTLTYRRWRVPARRPARRRCPAACARPSLRCCAA